MHAKKLVGCKKSTTACRRARSLSCDCSRLVCADRHDSFICVTWLVDMCDMTRSYVCHDPFICLKWLVHMCDMTHPYVWNDSFICVTKLICMCDMTRSFQRTETLSYEWNYLSFYLFLVCETNHFLCRHFGNDFVFKDLCLRTCVWGLVFKDLRSLVNMTHSHVWPDPFICVTWHSIIYHMGLLWLVGSFKL